MTDQNPGWCPRCGCNDSRVIKSRKHRYTFRGKAVTKRLRRHECLHCGCRFTTREEVLGGSVTPTPPTADHARD